MGLTVSKLRAIWLGILVVQCCWPSNLPAQEYYSLEAALANPSKVVKLVLSEEIIDPDWSQFTSLEYINLLDCELDSLHRGIEQLPALKVIEIRSSGLVYIAPDLNDSPKLVTLILSGNQLRQIPSLNQLLKLKTLDLSGNQLSRFPRLRNLPPNLDQLFLIGNPIKRVPRCAKKVSGLKL